jgi:WD40 repeat protein
VETGWSELALTTVGRRHGSWLATGGEDKTVRIWDTSTGQLRATFKSIVRHTLVRSYGQFGV